MITGRVEFVEKEMCSPRNRGTEYQRAQPGLSTCTIFPGTLFVSRGRNSVKKANSTGGVM